MAVAGEGNPFHVAAGLARRHGLAVVIAEEVGQFLVYKVVVCLADNFRFLCSEELLEHLIAEQIDTVCVFQADQVGDCFHQDAQAGFFLRQRTLCPLCAR